MIRLAEPQTETEWRQARRLVEEYAASLDLDLGFQDFAAEVTQLAVEYGRPKGAFLIAREGDAVLGCAGLREFSEGVGEIKRLYVVPQARRLGIGRRLTGQLIAVARDIGYARLLLDTLPSMAAAQSMYRQLGFVDTGAYRFNPVAGTVFLELRLT